MLYINIQKFNDGIRLSGQTPLDDSVVFETVNDLYISTGTATTHELYGRAYVGLIAAAADTGELYVCLNADPYTPGLVSTVNSMNFRTYWQWVGRELYEYVHGPVDSSIRTINSSLERINSSVNRLHDYDCSETLVEAADGAITVTYDYVSSIDGNKYAIGVNVDNDTVKIVNDEITGGKYKLTKLDESQLAEGVYSSYRLAYKAADRNTYVDFTDVQIDIPKLSVVDQVHVCKAIYDDETHTYIETAVQGECTEEEWIAAEGSVYLHIEWHTKDDDDDPGNDKYADTYIKVSDMISIDITGLNTSVNLLEGRATALEGRATALEGRATDLETRATNLEAYTQDTSNRLKNTTDDINASIIWNVSEINSSISWNVSNLNSSIQNSDSSITAIKNDISTYKVQAAQALADNVSTLNARIANVSTYAINVSNNLHSEIASMKQYVDTNVATLNTTINNKVSDCSTAANNKINAVQNNVDTLSSLHTTDMAAVNSHLGTLDASVSTFLKELEDTELVVAAELQRCEDARAQLVILESSVWENELVMAAALNRHESSIIDLYSKIPSTMSASPVTRSVKSVDTIDTSAAPVKTEVELSELFGYNEGDQVNIDMRAVSSADSLYVTKGQVNVPVLQTFREDSENFIYYFDYLDATGFRRSIVEIGMNDNSNLVVISKKIVTLCRIR